MPAGHPHVSKEGCRSGFRGDVPRERRSRRPAAAEPQDVFREFTFPAYRFIIAATKNAFLGNQKHRYGMQLMQNLREDLVADLFRTGAISRFALEVHDGHANIVYTLLDGSKGLVYTKRGQPKEYRIETALRLLRSLGLASVTVEMAQWSLDQRGLGF